MNAKKSPEKKEPTLKEICAELRIDPVAARRKLRKAWRSKEAKITHSRRQAWSGAWIREVLAKPKQTASKSAAS